MNVLSMGWEHLLFAHWDVEPSIVDDALPAGIEADTYDGRAYLGVVSFVMNDIRPRFVPSALGLTFGEVNLRTYVRADGDEGIYFFSLDADDVLGVTGARTFFSLPYYRATMDVETENGVVAFRSSRKHSGAPSAEFDATYEPMGEAFLAKEGSLEEFLTERYCFFVSGSSGKVYRGDVDHEPWRLQDATAEIRKNTMFETNGFEHPDDEPHLLYSKGVEVSAEPLRRMSSV